MQRCRTCICRTRLNTCCNRKNCKGKKSECERYKGFRQLSIFEKPIKRHEKLIRDYTWQDYGISKARYHELKEMCQSGKYTYLVRSVAHTTAQDIEEYIYLSVTKNMSYRALEAKWELGEMERMPYNHNDFYGYRRLFYHNLNEALKMGQNKQNTVR